MFAAPQSALDLATLSTSSVRVDVSASVYVNTYKLLALCQQRETGITLLVLVYAYEFMIHYPRFLDSIIWDYKIVNLNRQS